MFRRCFNLNALIPPGVPGYEFSGKEVPFWVNLQIAVAASLVMVIAMAFGDVMSKIFPSWSLDIIPGLVFVVLGVVAASEYIVELMQAEHPHEQGARTSKTLAPPSRPSTFRASEDS